MDTIGSNQIERKREMEMDRESEGVSAMLYHITERRINEFALYFLFLFCSIRNYGGRSMYRPTDKTIHNQSVEARGCWRLSLLFEV